MGVPANPSVAAALRQFNIPSNLQQWAVFRDYMVQYNETGVPDDVNAELQHISSLATAVAAAHLDTMQVILSIDASLTELKRRIAALEEASQERPES